MKKIDKYILKMKIRWLKQDLKSKTYYSKDKIKKWILELQYKLNNNG